MNDQNPPLFERFYAANKFSPAEQQGRILDQIVASKPMRIQRLRVKGWRIPPGAVYVGRPGKFGNPMKTVLGFDLWLKGAGKLRPHEEQRQHLLASLPKLRGKNLVCWCSLDKACHADVLLELANA